MPRSWLSQAGERAAELLNSNPALLNRAVFGAHVEVVRALLDAKASPDARPPNDRPIGGEAWPLRLAVQHGYTEICHLLLTHGARLENPPPSANAQRGSMSLQTREDDSGSLLGAAAFQGHRDIVELVSVVPYVTSASQGAPRRPAQRVPPAASSHHAQTPTHAVLTPWSHFPSYHYHVRRTCVRSCWMRMPTSMAAARAASCQDSSRH